MIGVQAAIKNGHDKVRVSDVAMIRAAVRLYAEDNGDYPNYPSGAYIAENNGNTLVQALRPYLPSIPSDPINVGAHNYRYDSGYNCSTGDINSGSNIVIYVPFETGAASNYNTSDCTPPDVDTYVVRIR